MAAPDWSQSENDRFKRALATQDRDEHGHWDWDRVAAAVGGGKTANDVRRHYDRLVHDIHSMEAGGAPGSNSNNRGGDAGPVAGTLNGRESNGRRRRQR